MKETNDGTLEEHCTYEMVDYCNNIKLKKLTVRTYKKD